MPLVFIMTMLLLTSSLTSVYAMYHMKTLTLENAALVTSNSIARFRVFRV